MYCKKYYAKNVILEHFNTSYLATVFLPSFVFCKAMNTQPSHSQSVSGESIDYFDPQSIEPLNPKNFDALSSGKESTFMFRSKWK